MTRAAVTLMAAMALAGCGRDAPERVDPAVGSVSLAATWVPGAGWPAEVVVALNSAWLAQNSQTTGDVAVVDASPGPTLADSAEAVVGVGVTLTGSVRADTVFVKFGGTVTGGVSYNGLTNNGTIQGPLSTPLGLPLPVTAPAFRVSLLHMSPFDVNWPFIPDTGGGGGGGSGPNGPDPRLGGGGPGGGGGGPTGGGGGPTGGGPPPKKSGSPCKEKGSSYIEAQNQTLEEEVALVGTPFKLHYAGDRVPGRREARTLDIPLSAATLPEKLQRIDLEVTIAGRRFAQTFPPVAGQTASFEWDGKDAYGRLLQGEQRVEVRIGNVFKGLYAAPDGAWARAFDQYGGVPLTFDRVRVEATIWRVWRSVLGVWDQQAAGLGGWSLGPHHTYDPAGRVLYRGDGSRRAVAAAGTVVQTVPVKAVGPEPPIGGLGGIAVAAEGSLYVMDVNSFRVRRIGLDGTVTTAAGNGTFGYSGDGGPATGAAIYGNHVALGPGGEVYFSDDLHHVVRRFVPGGNIATVAGTGTSGFGGDGGPATAAKLAFPAGLVVGPDGSVFIADGYNKRVRRVGPDGVIETIAGTGAYAGSPDGIPAAQASLLAPSHLALGPRGDLYVSDGTAAEDMRVRRIGPDGIIDTVAGVPGATCDWNGDGIAGKLAHLCGPKGVAVARDGSVLIANSNNTRIRRVGPTGIITTIAGTCSWGVPVCPPGAADGAPATSGTIGAGWIAVAPDGAVYFPSGLNSIRKLVPAMPGLELGGLLVAADDADEVYTFDSSGRHLVTRHSLTGAARYEFGYDANGRLATVKDGDGNVTSIARDAAGKPTKITGPYGQATTLALDGNGWLASVTSPANESHLAEYTTDGLLTKWTNPRGFATQYGYDAYGRVASATDPVPAQKTLGRTASPAGWKVTATTPLGRATSYDMVGGATGAETSTNTAPSGLSTTAVAGTDGKEAVSTPAGITVEQANGPDPRFGMQAPIVKSFQVTTPGGLSYQRTSSRGVTLANPQDPFSVTQQVDTTVVNGKEYKTFYDGTGKTLTTTTPLGRQAFVSLDAKGRVTGVQTVGLLAALLAYDSKGRLTALTQGTRTFGFAYDAQGNLASTTNPLLQTTGFQYDAAGRVTKETRPDGAFVLLGHDKNSNLTSLTPPGRPPHGFVYNAVNLLTDYVPPPVAGSGLNVTHYAYDVDRRLSSVTRPDGGVVQMGYDPAGRPKTLSMPTGTITFDYHPTTGMLTGATGSNGQALAYGWDGGLLKDATWSGAVSGNVHWDYDSSFRIASETVNGGFAAPYAYDADGLLSQVGPLALSSHPQNGLLVGTTMGQITDSYGYNGHGEVTAYEAKFQTTSLYSVQYARDALGRITQKTETVQGETHVFEYGYDPAGRLTDVAKDGAPIAHYQYDANGNRTAFTDPNGTVTATYDDQDRMLAYGKFAYTYTANGELKTKTDTSDGQVTTYVYDALGNLLSVKLPDGTLVEYVIDGNGRRVGKKLNGTLVQGFLYRDDLRIAAELDGAGNVVSRFVYADGAGVEVAPVAEALARLGLPATAEAVRAVAAHVSLAPLGPARPNDPVLARAPAYLVKGNDVYRFLVDNVGSPRLVIHTGTGQAVQRLEHDAFGRILLDTAPGVEPLAFAAGIRSEETGLIRFGARDYDTETGRWTSRDPAGLQRPSTNSYGYCNVDPINCTDTTGAAPMTCRQCEVGNWVYTTICMQAAVAGKPPAVIPFTVALCLGAFHLKAEECKPLCEKEKKEKERKEKEQSGAQICQDGSPV